METLEEHFDRLSETLKSLGVPNWDNVLIAEDLHVDPFSKQRVERNQLHSLAEYSDRFDSFLKEGHSWLNLSGLGILGDTLIVAVEKPRANSGSPLTSVNQSGPPNCVKDNNYSLEKFIEIRE
jgi:hypothetical protein